MSCQNVKHTFLIYNPGVPLILDLALIFSYKKYVGTIERGHIYFFYRPEVQLEEVHSIDEVKNFHMLLSPPSPALAITEENMSSSKAVNKTASSLSEEAEMKVLAPGADAVPLQSPRALRKKKLPDPEGRGSGSRRKEIF